MSNLPRGASPHPAPLRSHLSLRPALTLYAPLLQDDFRAGHGGTVSFAYVLELSVEQALDARLHTRSLLSE